MGAAEPCKLARLCATQDKNSDNKAAAEKKFKEISEAYEVWRSAGAGL